MTACLHLKYVISFGKRHRVSGSLNSSYFYYWIKHTKASSSSSNDTTIALSVTLYTIPLNSDVDLFKILKFYHLRRSCISISYSHNISVTEFMILVISLLKMQMRNILKLYQNLAIKPWGYLAGSQIRNTKTSSLQLL